MTTIHDVARASGVSISTVSRAMSRPEQVNATTRERVLAAAAELDYRPSTAARSLTSGRSMTLGLLVPDITNPFFFDLIRGTQGRSATAGYHQILIDTQESVELEQHHIAASAKESDGLVLAASRLTDEALAAAARTVPLVAINRSTPGVSSVVIDTPSGMGQAVDHLASLGHRKVAYLSGPRSSWSNARRWRAVQQAARRTGISARQLGPFPPTREAGAAAADAAVHAGVTAVLAFNDLIALGVLRRLFDRGLSVPEDMSVVGCDNTFGSDFCHPPLTTVSAPIEQAGQLATDMLLALLRSPVPSPRVHELPAVLTIRGSTGPVPRPRRSE
jgi:LacI family transcriptional regulator, repressor for deo operon, udp, cdd, tsx, nupC, and nupG